MRLTKIPKEIKMELSQLKATEFNLEDAWDNPTLFSHHILGMTPYTYQHYILRMFQKNYKENNKRTIICKSRQIGISHALAAIAIWAAITNQSKQGIHSNTKIGIISKGERQAIKLMALIKDLINYAKQPLVGQIKRDNNTPYNKTEIHFKNKCWIKCFPPTDACRGETFDYLIVDEAAFVDSEIFRKAMTPTVTKTDGIILLSSTPKGQKGYFYELFDPNDRIEDHPYQRTWFDRNICEDAVQIKIIEAERQLAIKTGNMKEFDQEYNALFTVDQEAFFTDIEVMKGVNKNLFEKYESTSPCSLSIDYGMTNADTTISIIEQTDKLRLIFQYSKQDFDENLLFDPKWDNNIKTLTERYNIIHMVADDCPQGSRSNKQMENEGYPLIRYNFKSDAHVKQRNRGFYLFRNALRHEGIEYPNNSEFIAQMKTIEETRMEQYMKIKAPKGYKDDRIDGIMMACFPFLGGEDSDFKSILVEYDRIIKETQKIQNNGRFDSQWDNLRTQSNTTSNMYDFIK